MRYVLLIVGLAIIYFVLARSGSLAPAKTAITESMDAANVQASPAAAADASASPHTNAFKAPIDRTNAVLDQVRKQKSENDF